MADRESTAQVWGAAVVLASALAVVAAYLINGAALVLVVAGVEVLLLMVHVGRRWRRLHRPAVPRGHQGAGGAPDAAHCERCRRAREALDARRARALPRPGPRAERREAHRDAHRDAGLSGHDGAGRDRHLQGYPGRQLPARELPGRDRPRREAPARELPGRDLAGPDRSGPDLGGQECRPAREWTAERAAARSLDRPTARHGAQGSAGRAVRHQ
ncbi:hypothetical protein [Kitasatospora sp. A2-31]|uniref:hypothetical protein n=1 Tax=Kitasatospora sp. A2-31 TaxID=2916414 RepID=UPI001EEEB277|nr:hypothetical protein [Kitasatospora sp. A2-31]MCG6499405.1 hypothetical protein [Kitasatospora sp. A2-31]